MSDKIIKLVEKKTSTPLEVAECMELFKKEVDKGAIAGFVIGYIRPDGDFGTIVTASTDACRLLGAAAYVTHRMADIIDKSD